MKAPFDFALRQARARPLAAIAAAFLLGALAVQGRALPLALSAALLVAAAGLAIALRRRPAALAALLLACFAAGMLRATLALDGIEPVETRYSAELVGRVASEPFANPDTGRLIFQFQLETVDGEADGRRLRLYLRDDEPPIQGIRCGQRLRLTGHIWKPDPVTNPYEFDFGAYLNRQGMSGYATAKLKDVEILDERRDLQTAVVAVRQAVSARIDALFPANAPLMRALALGDRSLLSEELRKSLNRTGMAHLISISGLHVTVLAALMTLLFRRFMSRMRANLIAVALLISYGALIGFSAPFVRALVMFALICFAPVAGRPSDPVTRLSAALLGFMLVNPLCAGDAGFVLSFSASAGILLLLPPLMSLFGLEAPSPVRPSASPARRAAAWLRQSALTLLCVSLAAQLATLPAVIAFFGVQSVVSLPFNLVCVPLCMLGYVIGAAALLVSIAFMPLAVLPARASDGLFTLLTEIARLGNKLPAASVRIGRYPALLVLAHCCIVFAASELSRIRLSIRKFLPLTLTAVAALASLVTFARAWNPSIVFLNADQADCAVVRTRGHTYLIDAGDTYTPAADYLNATCLHLDGVVLSHPHKDHAGGLASVLESFRPDDIYVPEGWFDAEEVSAAVTEGIQTARDMGVEIRELAAGDGIQLSETARLDVYSPAPGERYDAVNDMSMVALVTLEGHGALFTGDISADAEPEIIPDADVLKVAHHGSDKATSRRFLEACSPDYAIVTAGENNYGHPSPDTLDRLADCGAQVLLTRDCGAVTLSLSGNQWRVDTYLEATDELE